MTVKIGINGLGRIGRMVVRSIIENKNKNCSPSNLQIKNFKVRAASST